MYLKISRDQLKILWGRVGGASKRIFATIKSTIDAVKFSNTIQLSPF